MIIRSNNIKLSVADAVRSGLNAKKKYLPSWLFYDQRGDELFQEIMQLPEYYLTRCESEILELYSTAIAYNFLQESSKWTIIELGSGDGSKTLKMLKAFSEAGIKVEYFPFDISENALNMVQRNVSESLPSIKVTPIQAEYNEAFQFVSGNKNPVLVLFMGGNIGNFERNNAAAFLNTMSAQMQQRDRMLIGMDLMKSPSVIEKAYNDYTGVTTLFNKNLLRRINDELAADFDLTQFEHWPIYDAVTGACRSYLVSLKKQTVNIKDLNLQVDFKPWETIYTEISQKYSEEMIYELMMVSNLSVEKLLFDQKKFYSVAMVRSIGSS